ncbi:MAG: hypothetical protein LPK85_11760 [Gammaproteobacteria bacterium]|nr:hypothetical protein [Gammaproteobacteria bacterium]
MSTSHSDDNIVPLRPRQRLRRWLIASLLLILGIVVLSGIGLWLVANAQGVAAAHSLAEALQNYAVIVRIALYVSLVGFWPAIVDRMLQGSESGDVEDQRQALLQMRKRIVLWILVFELLLVQRLPILLLQELS